MTSPRPTREVFVLRWLLLVAIGLLAVGLTTPMITLTKLMFSEHSFSVLGGIAQLFTDRQILIAIILVSFSVLLPLIKITLLFRALSLLSPNHPFTARRQRYLRLMHDYGRWAMLDVMVVAVIIVTVKLGAIASIQVHTGLYLFGAAVLLIMFITHRVVHLSDRYIAHASS